MTPGLGLLRRGVAREQGVLRQLLERTPRRTLARRGLSPTPR